MLPLTLLLSSLALLAGVAIVWAGQDRPVVRLIVEGFTLGVVPTLVAARIVPHVWVHLGLLTPGLIAAGYGVFWVAERAAERWLLTRVVVAWLSLHSLIDGVSLAVAQGVSMGGATTALLGALVLHRLPEGLLVGRLVIPRHGLAPAAISAAVLVVMTIAGAAVGRELQLHLDGLSFGAIVAATMGALLGAVFHEGAAMRLRARPSWLSAMVGVGLALAVPDAL